MYYFADDLEPNNTYYIIKQDPIITESPSFSIKLFKKKDIENIDPKIIEFIKVRLSYDSIIKITDFNDKIIYTNKILLKSSPFYKNEVESYNIELFNDLINKNYETKNSSTIILIIYKNMIVFYLLVLPKKNYVITKVIYTNEKVNHFEAVGSYKIKNVELCLNNKDIQSFLIDTDHVYLNDGTVIGKRLQYQAFPEIETILIKQTDCVEFKLKLSKIKTVLDIFKNKKDDFLMIAINPYIHEDKGTVIFRTRERTFFLLKKDNTKKPSGVNIDVTLFNNVINNIVDKNKVKLKFTIVDDSYLKMCHESEKQIWIFYSTSTF